MSFNRSYYNYESYLVFSRETLVSIVSSLVVIAESHPRKFISICQYAMCVGRVRYWRKSRLSNEIILFVMENPVTFWRIPAS